VGDEGDANRRLNSDPVLWDFVGDVSGLDVLDAGCGTGYLCKKLRDRGARVTGVDHSKEMIAIARSKIPELSFFIDSISTLSELRDDSFDLVVANYVLMDCEDLTGAVESIYRVLRTGGRAVVVFSHPCFPQGCAEIEPDGLHTYAWDFVYFEQGRRVDPPWAHFTSPFVWFHRPLSDYWKAFTRTGFSVLEFEEPRITPARYSRAESSRQLMSCKTRPYSVAFQLRKDAVRPK
jgi:ubiquinone/menaquinone biosynthesis C-methylase UbiE